MNRTFLPPLAAALRTLGAYPDRPDVTDATLADIAAELDRARRLVAAARGLTANPCPRHPRGPVDPADGGRCLLCRTSASTRAEQPEPSRQPEPAEVLAAIAEHGANAAARQYGGHTVTRALALNHHLQPTKPRPEGAPHA